jgi:hypothetical protein
LKKSGFAFQGLLEISHQDDWTIGVKFAVPLYFKNVFCLCNVPIGMRSRMHYRRDDLSSLVSGSIHLSSDIRKGIWRGIRSFYWKQWEWIGTANQIGVAEYRVWKGLEDEEVSEIKEQLKEFNCIIDDATKVETFSSSSKGHILGGLDAEVVSGEEMSQARIAALGASSSAHPMSSVPRQTPSDDYIDLCSSSEEEEM